MPIRKRWSRFTVEELLRLVPRKPGIYELGDAKGEVVYIGSSDPGEDIRGRLNFHRRNKPRSVKCFRFDLGDIFQRPLLMEQYHCKLFEAKHGRLPRLQKRMPRGYLPLL